MINVKTIICNAIFDFCYRQKQQKRRKELWLIWHLTANCIKLTKSEVPDQSGNCALCPCFQVLVLMSERVPTRQSINLNPQRTPKNSFTKQKHVKIFRWEKVTDLVIVLIIFFSLVKYSWNCPSNHTLETLLGTVYKRRPLFLLLSA